MAPHDSIHAMFSKRAIAYWLTAAVVSVQAIYLLWAGREPYCKCGYVKLWHGDNWSPENSQHISDWYTPSHILHGLIFYAAIWLILPRLAFGWRLALGTAVEAAWEMVENSNAVIERYREVTISLDYYGDSVLNSVCDTLAMVAGFYLARVIPVWASVAIIVGFEALTTYLIRDGLALNIIMLLWPSQAILDWQSAIYSGP